MRRLVQRWKLLLLGGLGMRRCQLAKNVCDENLKSVT